MRINSHLNNPEGHMLIIGSPIGNGVANRILFSDANVLLAVDNDLVWDEANVRLGIGTSNPQTSLEVASGQITVQGGTQISPSYSFVGDSNTGIFNRNPDTLSFSVGNLRVWEINSSGDLVGNVNGQTISAFNADGGNLIFKARDSGVALVEVARLQGAADPYFKASNFYALISGNVGIGIASPASGLEMGNDVLLAQDVNAGLVAGTTQTQAGGLALTAQINQVSVVANTNDTGVLPVLPTTGSLSVTIINDGANTMRIFPGVGDDLGAGVNAVDAVNIPTGTARTYISYNGTNWQKYLSE